MRPIINWIESASQAAAVLCVAMMMLIVSFDAIARYALNAPLPWSFELISYYLLTATAYFALSATFRTGDHISIDLFRTLMSRRFRAVIDAVWSVLGAGVFGIITYGAWIEMSHAIARGDFFPGFITWPVWPAYLPILVGGVVLTARLVLHAWVLLVEGRDEDVSDHLESDIEEHHE